MNINDFERPDMIEKGLLEDIFKRQSSLMIKYHHIEAKTGLMQTEDCPVNLHDQKGQARLKDFAWRITEEIGEATEALGQGDMPHFFEEMVDALHFMIEQHILIGLSPADYLPLNEEEVDEALSAYYHKIPAHDDFYLVIETLALSMNCLKNKPWKQSHMMTDETKFLGLSKLVFLRWLGLMKFYGLTPQEIHDLYFRKSEVNKFRQRSNY